MSKVTLDLGHGGNDSGAFYKNLIEKDIVLIVGKECEKVLLEHNVNVQMTRTSDVYVGLTERTNMANLNNSQYFVSIHCNAGGGDRGEVIHSIYSGKGVELSSNIAAELKVIGQNIVKEYDKKGDYGTDYYAVIRQTNMDSVIVECAFLDNEIDNIIIDTIEEQKMFGLAIAKGILKQLGITYKMYSSTLTNPIKPSGLYRVRELWADESSQIGAYSDLTNAKKCADRNSGYSIFNSNGVKVYPTNINEKIDIYYKTYSDGRWYEDVKNLEDYAGVIGKNIECVMAKLNKGSIEYRVSSINANYYSWVRNYDDFAGINGKHIDRLQMRLIGLYEYKVKYRVHIIDGDWLPWVIGDSDYAGIIGHGIDAIEIDIV
ncbi:MAG: N-acetylmuramoyl-L-alanine amidase [Clostridium sp.]|uniref:N-acetylmuramoyl-L-alanine amidase n=1 Tax=Clostridium sp. TaxID=1506 RepID=UPI0030610C17